MADADQDAQERRQQLAFIHEERMKAIAAGCKAPDVQEREAQAAIARAQADAERARADRARAAVAHTLGFRVPVVLALIAAAVTTAILFGLKDQFHPALLWPIWSVCGVLGLMAILASLGLAKSLATTDSATSKPQPSVEQAS